VNAETVHMVAAAGANAIVAGSGVFKDGDYAGNIATIRARALSPFYNNVQLNAVTGQAMLEPESLNFFPADSIRLSFESEKIPWALRYQATLTPLGDHAPWRIDYYIKTGVASPAQNANEPLPLPAALPAAADAAL